MVFNLVNLLLAIYITVLSADIAIQNLEKMCHLLLHSMNGTEIKLLLKMGTP